MKVRSGRARRVWVRRLARLRRDQRRRFGRAGGAWAAFVSWFNTREPSENAILLGFAVVIGVAGAMGVVGFYKAIDLAYDLFIQIPSDRLSREDFLAYRPMLTGGGFVLAWWLMRRFGRDHDGMTVPDVQYAVARRDGRIPTRPALARTVASAVTLGSGGSAGSEGPVAVLGSTIGSLLGGAFRFDASRVKVLVGAGAAAGISAAFNAPLAGAFFALEEVLGSFAVRAFPPVVVSSVMAAVVAHAFLGNNPAFPVPAEYGYTLAREVLLFYPVLGILAGLVSVLFVRTYFMIGETVRSFRIAPPLLALLGGAGVGVLVHLSGGELAGYGHLAFRVELFGRMTMLALVLLALGKIVATSITLNTGASGGVFTPALYVGAATGGAFGVGLSALFPELGLSPEAYALVGMGAVVAAATDAPLTGILIVFEMTNDYAIMLPLMLTTVIAYVVARRIEPDSLYSGWLRRRGQTIAHGADLGVLAGIPVADAYNRNPHVIHEASNVAKILAHLDVASEQVEFPVVDDERRLVGMITLTDLGRIAKDQRDLADIILAADVARPAEAVTPGDTLLVAMRRMGVRGGASVPVVEPATATLLGVLDRGHIVALYERATAGLPLHGTDRPV
ncbi:MAG: chloride channel protein [Longimicrobiales bacterium]